MSQKETTQAINEKLLPAYHQTLEAPRFRPSQLDPQDLSIYMEVLQGGLMNISRLLRAVEQTAQRFSPQELIHNPKLTQEILESFITDQPLKDQRVRFAGLPTSLLINQLANTLHPEDQSQIKQDLNLSTLPPVDYLAYEWGAGKMSVQGLAGNYFASGLRDGQVTAEEVGHWAAHKATGGKLIVRNAKGWFGAELQGAKILAKKVGDQCGWKASKGQIEVTDFAKEYLGSGLDGASIKADITLDWCGYQMRAGEIKILDSTGNYLGNQMTGGKIEVENAAFLVGHQQSGGEISVKRFQSLGDTIGNGKILIPNNHN